MTIELMRFSTQGQTSTTVHSDAVTDVNVTFSVEKGTYDLCHRSATLFAPTYQQLCLVTNELRKKYEQIREEVTPKATNP